MKKVLTLCAQPLFEPRGSPIRVRAFLRVLGQANFGVEVVTLPVGPDAPLPESIKLVRVPNFLWVKSVAIGPSLPKLAFGVLIGIYALVRSSTRPYEVVHGIEEMGLPAWIAARLGGARFVYEKHSDPASHRSQSRIRNGVMALYGRVERFVCRRADIVIATGPGLAEQTRRYGTRAEIRVIDDVPSSERDPDPASIPTWRERFGCRQGEVVFAYIGSFAGYQGVPLLLEALRIHLPENPFSRAVLVGGSESDQLEVRQLAEAGGFPDRVCHLPRIDFDEVPDFLAACDVLISPRLEGNNTPLKVLDYLRSGRCILATDTEANRLVLDPSVARIAPPDPEVLAAGMRHLAGDPALRERLGNAGRERFETRFGFDRFRQAVLQVFGKADSRISAREPE